MNSLIDIILWNPPYVPTPTEEILKPTLENSKLDNTIQASWAGGTNGREVIDRFLLHIPVPLI